MLFIADEVITGFGRLGTWFGIEHFDVQPDILVFAKGIAAGYAPLGGFAATDARSSSRSWRVQAASSTTSPMPGTRSLSRSVRQLSRSCSATASWSESPVWSGTSSRLSVAISAASDRR